MKVSGCQAYIFRIWGCCKVGQDVMRCKMDARGSGHDNEAIRERHPRGRGSMFFRHVKRQCNSRAVTCDIPLLVNRDGSADDLNHNRLHGAVKSLSYHFPEKMQIMGAWAIWMTKEPTQQGWLQARIKTDQIAPARSPTAQALVLHPLGSKALWGGRADNRRSRIAHPPKHDPRPGRCQCP